MSATGDERDFLELTKDWEPSAKARAMEAYRLRQSGTRQFWYCDRPRTCDGLPHVGFEYRHARADQWPPEGTDWFIWFLMSGRGAGKTRSGSGWVRKVADHVGRIAGVARRGPDFRQTMIEGAAGLIYSCELAGESYDWKPALKEFTFQNGAKLFGYSGEEPNTLRGPEHGAAWLDEPAHMPLIEDVWSNLLFGLRIPGMPGGAKVLLTSTPLPTKWVKARAKEPTTRLIRVSTQANIDNLDDAYKRNVVEPMVGTRLGRQELDGEILEDILGALWGMDMLHYYDDAEVPFESMERIVIGVDPAGTVNKRSDETGIVVCGRLGTTGYVIDDSTDKYSPAAWAAEVQRLYNLYQADAVVVETNFGGDMVRRNLVAAGFTGLIKETRATRGKQVRAEPVVNLYEQERIYHRKTERLRALEDEQLGWVPGDGPSPNRIDALVWAFTDLMKVGGVGHLARPADTNPAVPNGGWGLPERRYGT